MVVVMIITVVMMVVSMFATTDQDHWPGRGGDLGGVHPGAFVGATDAGGSIGVERDGQIGRVQIGARTSHNAPGRSGVGSCFEARFAGTCDGGSLRGRYICPDAQKSLWVTPQCELALGAAEPLLLGLATQRTFANQAEFSVMLLEASAAAERVARVVSLAL